MKKFLWSLVCGAMVFGNTTRSEAGVIFAFQEVGGNWVAT